MTTIFIIIYTWLFYCYYGAINKSASFTRCALHRFYIGTIRNAYEELCLKLRSSWTWSDSFSTVCALFVDGVCVLIVCVFFNRWLSLFSVIINLMLYTISSTNNEIWILITSNLLNNSLSQFTSTLYGACLFLETLFLFGFILYVLFIVHNGLLSFVIL